MTSCSPGNVDATGGAALAAKGTGASEEECNWGGETDRCEKPLTVWPGNCFNGEEDVTIAGAGETGSALLVGAE